MGLGAPLVYHMEALLKRGRSFNLHALPETLPLVDGLYSEPAISNDSRTGSSSI